MANANAIEIGSRFEFGRVVSQTAGLIFRNFFLFVFLALVFVGVPQFGIIYGQQVAVSTTDPGLMVLVSIGGALVTMIMSFVLQGALTRAAVDDLSGSGVRFGAAIGDGLRFFFPLLIVAILVGLGTFLGLLLLIVPGIILAVRWAVTAPVVVLEQAGPTSSMGRAAELSRGHRWAIFGLFLLYLAFAYAVQILFGLIMAAFGMGNAAQLLTMDGIGLVFSIASAAIAALVSLVSTVGTAALYFELRRVKEGVGVEELARVFD